MMYIDNDQTLSYKKMEREREKLQSGKAIAPSKFMCDN